MWCASSAAIDTLIIAMPTARVIRPGRRAVGEVELAGRKAVLPHRGIIGKRRLHLITEHPEVLPLAPRQIEPRAKAVFNSRHAWRGDRGGTIG
jgi:hypothetical protein